MQLVIEDHITTQKAICNGLEKFAYSAVGYPINSTFNLLKNQKNFESIEEKRLMREYILQD